MKTCTKCELPKSLDDFTKRSDRKNSYMSQCKSCRTEISKIKTKAAIAECIRLKGSCCSMCGYSKCQGALEFHHIDPTTKSFEINASRVSVVSKKVLQELNKCVLLCANCHREHHYIE